MNIRAKLYLIILPLISVAVILGALFAYSSAASALEKTAREVLGQKAVWIQRYMNDQAILLMDEGYFGDESMQQAAIAGIENYANDLLRDGAGGGAEIIAAFDGIDRLVFFAGESARKKDAALLIRGERKYLTAQVLSEAFSVRVYTARERRDVLKSLDYLIPVSLGCLLLALATAVVFLRFLAAAIAHPAAQMKSAFDAYSFDRLAKNAKEYPAVNVPSNDEIGALAASYNAMMAKFALAEQELNVFALRQEAERNIEEKRRNVFQLYAPEDVVRKVLKTPSELLAGAKYDSAILHLGERKAVPFSDTLPPAAFVALMTRYFVRMAAIVRRKTGVNFNVDGSALTAGWGVPESQENDVLNAVHAALLMVDALPDINGENEDMGLPPLEIGIGIDTGLVTAGTIALDNRINWTVMGGPVSIAGQLQRLSRNYREAVLFTESVYKKVYSYFPCRFVDKVALAGSPAGVSLYTARLEIAGDQKEAWKYHRMAVKLFYARKFTEAKNQFEQALSKDADDKISSLFIGRCRKYIKAPPPPMWDGTTGAFFPGNGIADRNF